MQGIVHWCQSMQIPCVHFQHIHAISILDCASKLISAFLQNDDFLLCGKLSFLFCMLCTRTVTLNAQEFCSFLLSFRGKSSVSPAVPVYIHTSDPAGRASPSEGRSGGRLVVTHHWVTIEVLYSTPPSHPSPPTCPLPQPFPLVPGMDDRCRGMWLRLARGGGIRHWGGEQL